MKKIIMIAPAILLLAASCSPSSPSNTNQSQTSNNVQVKSADTSTGQKFSDQPYAQYAYLISGDTLGSDAQKALNGFTMDKKSLPDGSVQITLTAQKSEYHNQQYTVKPGEKLYFLEHFLGDDQAGEDKNMGDDSAVLVDSQGNVIQGPQTWSN